MPYMKVVIQALRESDLRDKLLVFVGGAPLNAAFAEDIEADAYCRDAAVAVETAKKLTAIRRGQL
jgi:5-methyltetrahydrofolate--homocysteine methyltransferase